MAHVVEINRVDALEPYRLLWTLLLGSTRGASFFQSLDWLEAYWRHFGRAQKLCVLIPYSGTTPIGIMPLTIVRKKTPMGRVRVLTYPFNHGASLRWASLCGPVGPDPTATLMTIMRHLRTTRRDWDILDLPGTRANGHDRGRTRRAMQAAGFQTQIAAAQSSLLVDTGGSWADYLARRTGRLRIDLRRCQRRLATFADVRYVRYRPVGAARGDGDPRWDLLDACARLGRSDSPSENTSPFGGAFFRQVHQQAAKTGSLDLSLLTLGGRAIAFAYAYHHQGSVCVLQLGSTPEFADETASPVLLADMLKDSFQRGDSTVDLGAARLPAARPWLTHMVKCYRCRHYRIGAARVQLLRLAHWWQGRGSPSVQG